jgi:hypothetical protein
MSKITIGLTVRGRNTIASFTIAFVRILHNYAILCYCIIHGGDEFLDGGIVLEFTHLNQMARIGPKIWTEPSQAGGGSV